MKLSVIIPAYNEEKRIPRTLRDIHNYLRNQDYQWEIIVVSDGSTDNTVGAVKDLSSEIDNLRVIDFEQNKGKGFGVKVGMLEAEGDYRLFADADNSTSIDQVEKMWPEFEAGFDIVIGSRDVKGAELRPPQPFHRRLLGEVFGLFVSLTCGLWRIKDSQCGFKGFTKQSTEDIFPRAKIKGFAFDPEILALAKKLDYKIKEIPVIWKNDPDSKVNFGNMIKMGKDLLRIRANFIKNKYGLR